MVQAGSNGRFSMGAQRCSAVVSAAPALTSRNRNHCRSRHLTTRFR
jgi:hypothetical protein